MKSWSSWSTLALAGAAAAAAAAVGCGTAASDSSPTGGSPATGVAGRNSVGGTSSTGGTLGAGGASAGGPSMAGNVTAGAATTGGASGVSGAPAAGGSSVGGAGMATAGSAGASPGGTGLGSGGTGFYQMERLNRGLVAVPVSGGVYVGWRMFGFEYDAQTPANVSYNLYRDGTKIASVSDSTNYLDAAGTSAAKYTVKAVLAGVEQVVSESASPWAQNYLRIPLQPPSSIYSASDASVGDVDGDGGYEIILKWDPNDSRDNSQAGVTSDVFIDALKLDGTRLWRINLGPNIRAGAHYTQFNVYDFDGDGKAEVSMKTAPGTKDGKGAFLHLGPAANDDDSMKYRNGDGYVLSGPEYLTVFSGLTGEELATVTFDVGRGTVSAWGDSYGNRVDRFLSSVAFLDATGLPSFIMARGYYTRTTLTAWNYRGGALTQLWKFDSNQTPSDAAGNAFSGQGAHSMTIANVDDDASQEVMYGAMAVDNTGKGLCSTGFHHGDAEHVGDLIPSRPGIEMFMCNEDGSHPAYHIRDARTCKNIQSGPINGEDTGRCVADDISPDSPGAEMWASSVDGVFASATNAKLPGTKPASQNFLIWWDADETRELEDKTSITKYGGGTLLNCAECASNNGTKATPVLSADLFGDWREEIIWRETNNTALRLYTTTDVTKRRIYTLMHDAQYRMQVSAEQTAYNQPPHPSFHIGSGMVAPPAPNMKAR